MKKLIRTKDNSFIVDVGAEIKKGDWWLHHSGEATNDRYLHINPKLDFKILYSLNKISDDIPLFEIVEDDVEDKIYQAIGLSANEQGIINQALATKKVLEIYNQAKAAKGYSEEDLISAIRKGKLAGIAFCHAKEEVITEEQILSEINQPKEQEIEVITEWVKDFPRGNFGGAGSIDIEQPKLTKEGKVQIKLK